MSFKLYYSPGACSLSPHIALREAGLPFDLVKVDLGAKTYGAGADFLAVNPKGYVPALGLPDGQLITEGAIIVQYIADQRPESRLAPRAGTIERVRLAEWRPAIRLHVRPASVVRPKFHVRRPYPILAGTSLAARVSSAISASLWKTTAPLHVRGDREIISRCRGCGPRRAAGSGGCKRPDRGGIRKIRIRGS